MGWGTDNVPVDATQLTALRSNRRGQGTQHVMKMLRHMWVGWGWGGALITFLLMLRNSQLYVANAGTRYATCDEDATPHVGWVGMGWGTDNVPVDATQLKALRSNRRGQGMQHVMKMLRHMWVGWGWGGALITFLLMLRNSQLDAATAGTRYATCDEDATPHVGWVGMGWGTDNVPVDATQLTALRSNRRGQGTQHVMKMLRHMWIGWGWGGGTDNVPVDATQLTALRSNRRGQGTQHVMKMLRHMWVGWGWGGALITFLLMLRNSQLYAATAGDKVRNMWWRSRYAATRFYYVFYNTLQIQWFCERSIMKNPWITPGR